MTPDTINTSRYTDTRLQANTCKYKRAAAEARQEEEDAVERLQPDLVKLSVLHVVGMQLRLVLTYQRCGSRVHSVGAT